MTVLRVEDMGGPPFVAEHGCGCTCGSCSATQSTGSRSYLPSFPGPCEPTAPGNEPITSEMYRCSLGVGLQPTLDRARAIVHRLGFRPYRVFLVWQQRGAGEVWTEHHRCELMPVKVLTLENVEINASEWGETLVGGVALAEISPQQVTEDTLRGYIDDEDWASKSERREFFYEVVMHQRCTSELVPRRRRFYQVSEPSFDAESFGFSVSVGQQNIERSRDGVDQTIGTVNPDGTPLLPKPRLVT